MYEDHDRAIVEFHAGDISVNSRPKEVDEIANYLEARYVSASEACYRLFSFELHANLPHVMRLALDLEGRQSVVFRDTADLEAVFNGQNSTLTGWFRVNEKFPSAHCITYTNLLNNLCGTNPNTNGKKG